MTAIVSYSSSDISPAHPRRSVRDMPYEEFVERWGSGTLRKAARLHFDVRDAYIQERVRFEFGHGFEALQRSRVTYTDIKLEACQALTELGWHAERMIELRPFDSDVFVCKHIDVEYANGRVKRGAGMLVLETSCTWIPQGYMVFCIVAERVGQQYKNAINPF